MFVSQKAPHKRLSDDGVRYILKTIQSRDVRLKGLQISPHTFRRTCGTDMINRGAPAELVQKKLGHTKVDTTLQCYAKISQEAARDAERRYGVAG
ncbi:MAG: tyrosine-type recombinase/integrase [[Clostridium] symbiosum]